MKISAIATAMAILFSASMAYAHGGGTDSKGCHTNHKTGEFHCHNRK